MNRHEQDQLLNELIAGEEVSEFRRASLTRALDAIQRRKRRRRALRVGVLAAVPLLLAMAALLRRALDSRVGTEGAAGSEVVAVAPARVESAPVQHITDEELFGLFPDRPLALIGPPGRQRLVFLDKTTRRSDAEGL